MVEPGMNPDWKRNEVPTASPVASLGGCLVLLIPLAWLGSCVFDSDTKDASERVARETANQQRVEARRSADIARYSDDPLLVASARTSSDGDAVRHTMVALGAKCRQVVSVTPLSTPMTYEVICSNGSTGVRLNAAKYRLNTAAGISELMR